MPSDLLTPFLPQVSSLPLSQPVSLPLSLPWVLFLLLLAPALGSFLGVLVDRLPRGEDVLRSRCRSCAHRLGLRDLLPILSFAASRGRCRHCRAVIPPWSLYLEITATGAAVLALAAGGSLAEVLFSCLFLWLLLALAACDLIWLRLPDLLTAALALLVFAWVGLGAGLEFRLGLEFELALVGAGLGLGSFLALRLGYRAWRGREGLGLGDVKLMVGLGAFAGPFDLPLLVLMAALMGLTGGGAAAWIKRRQRLGAAAIGSPPLGQQALPFGAALCAAAALLWLLRALDLSPG